MEIRDVVLFVWVSTEKKERNSEAESVRERDRCDLRGGATPPSSVVAAGNSKPRDRAARDERQIN